MEDGLTDISDLGLRAILQDRTNRRYTKEYIELVHQELLARGLSLEEKMTEAEQEELKGLSQDGSREVVQNVGRQLYFRYIVGLLILVIAFFSFIVLNKKYWNLSSGNFEQIANLIFYLVLSVIVYLMFCYPSVKNKFITSSLFVFYLTIAAFFMSRGDLTFWQSHSQQENLGSHTLLFYFLITLALVYITDKLVSRFKKD